MSVRCCGEADESDGAEHAQWCQSYDFGAHIAAARREGRAQAIEALRAGELDQADQEIDALRAQVSSLTAENERLRKERDEAQEIRRRLGQTIKAFPDAHHAANLAHCRDERDALRAEVSSLRELESAARAWVAEAYARGVDPAEEHALTAALIAAVDALPPTPPATEEIDD